MYETGICILNSIETMYMLKKRQVHQRVKSA